MDGRHEELRLLEKARAWACQCKTKLLEGDATTSTKLDDLPAMDFAGLLAVASSFRQPTGVSEAAVHLLVERAPNASVDELASAFEGGRSDVLSQGKARLVPARERVDCGQRPNSSYPGYMWTALGQHRSEVSAAIWGRREALAKAERSRIADEARQRDAEAHTVAARSALAAAKYRDAVREADAAERAGAPVADLRTQISAAKAVASQQHQERAREFARKNDPDAALKEVEQAEELADGSVSLMDLREEVARTPKARQREALRRKEAAQAARCVALVQLCALNKERYLDEQTVMRSQATSCPQGFSAEAAACYNEHSSVISGLQRRYAPEMARLQQRAEKCLGRSLLDGDCCAALPSEYHQYATNCYPR
jgi:hypothetical protein